MSNWQVKHEQVISSFLVYLNERSEGFVLKGGTALLTCYGLDRFSEDIDLDGVDTNIKDIVEKFCEKYNYSYRVPKDTDTAKRYMVHYGNTGNGDKPLKIETSHRRKNIGVDETVKINGILTYNIDTLCIMKSNAYMTRDKIRDLYDISFICNQYYNQLTPQTIFVLRNAIEYKGIGQFDYIIREEKDPLIDNEKLMDAFLDMYDKLGLLYGDDERKTLLALKDNLGVRYSEILAPALRRLELEDVEKNKTQGSNEALEDDCDIELVELLRVRDEGNSEKAIAKIKIDDSMLEAYIKVVESETGELYVKVPDALPDGIRKKITEVVLSEYKEQTKFMDKYRTAIPAEREKEVPKRNSDER